MKRNSKLIIFIFSILILIILAILIYRDLLKLREPFFTPRDSKISSIFQPKKTICILSVDGGGVRGIIPGYVLKYLEDNTKMPISSSFDLITGTSTGAIAAVVLTIPNENKQPKYTTQTLIDFYNDYAPSLFKTTLYYRIITLEGILGPKFSPEERQLIYDQKLGNVTLHQLLGHVALPIYDWDHETPITLHNWSAPNENNADYYIKDVLAGATSPLAFFPAIKIQSVDHKQTHIIADGGIYADNPAMIALLQAQKLYPQARYLLVSLGTGVALPIDTSKIAATQNWGIAHWLNNVFNVVGLAQKSEVDHMLHYMESILNENSPSDKPNFTYYRIDILLPRNRIHIADYSPENLAALNQYGKQIVKENKVVLDQISRVLIANHPQPN